MLLIITEKIVIVVKWPSLKLIFQGLSDEILVMDK